MKNWKRVIAYLLGFGTLGSGSMVVLDYAAPWLFDSGMAVNKEMPEAIAAPENKKEALSKDSLAWKSDRDEDVDDWDEHFRSSDLEGERPTQYSRQRNKKEKDVGRVPPVPKGAKRVGCLCMDDVEQEKTGNGACSGRGGVRFWIYELQDGNLHQHPTERHLFNPDPLDEVALSNLAAHQENKTILASYRGRSGWGFFEMMTVVFVCLTASYIAFLYFGQSKSA